MANTSSVSVQMKDILDRYGREAKKAIDASAEETAGMCVQQLKNNSPKRQGKGGGAYARSWTVKKEGHGDIADYIVHNSKHYQLTHLLENGHVIRNKKGTYGRTHGVKHIAPAAEAAEQRFESSVRSKLEGI